VTVPSNIRFLRLTSELYPIRSAFYQGNYQNVIAEPVDNLTRSDEGQLYKYRARIELGQAPVVVAEMEDVGTTGAGFEAVKAYAEYRMGQREKAMTELGELIQADADDNTVQVLGATMLSTEGRMEEAFDLLSQHENNLEAYSVGWV
jgi:predicted Zn-dependent protease